jgi:hypothetical protein
MVGEVKRKCMPFGGTISWFRTYMPGVLLQVLWALHPVGNIEESLCKPDWVDGWIHCRV